MHSSDDAASIEYIAPVGSQYVSIRIDLLWDENANDWRVDLSSGEPASVIVNDPSTFTDWK